MPEALTGRKRNRALSLVFVEDIEAMEEMLGLNRDRHAGHCGEGKMMVRHWGRMKRVFESVVISCPETMRVHMVRYNLQSNMQQYKLDGLVAALAQVEQCTEFVVSPGLEQAGQTEGIGRDKAEGGSV